MYEFGVSPVNHSDSDVVVIILWQCVDSSQAFLFLYNTEFAVKISTCINNIVSPHF